MTPGAPWKVVSVDVRPGYVLHVRFADGVDGDVDMGPLHARPDLASTAFGPLVETSYFARASIEHGAVTWPNGADLAPDAMDEAIAAGGVWRPG